MRTKYTAEFEAFWEQYPKRWVTSSGRWVKIGKFEAFQVWNRLSKADHQDIMAVIKRVRAGKFTLDAHRWLKKRRWEDFEDTPVRPPPVKQDPELAASDNKQREIAKLTQGLGNKMAGD